MAPYGMSNIVTDDRLHMYNGVQPCHLLVRALSCFYKKVEIIDFGTLSNLNISGDIKSRYPKITAAMEKLLYF